VRQSAEPVHYEEDDLGIGFLRQLSHKVEVHAG
jgi:hypothetical protein